MYWNMSWTVYANNFIVQKYLIHTTKGYTIQYQILSYKYSSRDSPFRKNGFSKGYNSVQRHVLCEGMIILSAENKGNRRIGEIKD